jgi:serine/threonine protein kinase
MTTRGQLTGLAPGARVAGYLIEELIGTGGMAAVYRARDVGLGRRVALKVLTGDAAIRERFAGEALAAAAVDHPHIIPVYAAGEADGGQYIAMRLVVGEDLHALVRREGGLPARRAVGFISPVASALDAAHEAGLVHRDVKPANILVDTRPGGPEHVYLSDFGVARHLRSLGALTVPGQFLGTPDYAAPEQASGQPVDGRADQYALACVAYELLSGAVPFKRDEPVLVLYAHVAATPPRLTDARPELPPAADAVLAKAMDKLPERRYDSCGEFADALREALGFDPYDPRRSQALPITARPREQAAGTRTMTIPEPALPRPAAPRPAAPRPAAPRPAAPHAATPAPSASPGPQTQPLTPPGGRPKAAPPAAAPPPADRPAGVIPPPSPRPAPSLPEGRAAGAAPAPAGTWTALVTADRAYYDHVRAADEADASSISFPAYVAQRRFRLAGSQVRIGRRSSSLHVQPEIDLAGPPLDKGVSRLHAALTRNDDGTWSVMDLGSPNGITVNGQDVPSGVPVPLSPGDRIHLGFWTLITIARD